MDHSEESTLPYIEDDGEDPEYDPSDKPFNISLVWVLYI